MDQAYLSFEIFPTHIILFVSKVTLAAAAPNLLEKNSPVEYKEPGAYVHDYCSHDNSRCADH
jgi:hypothetical protein